MATVSARCGELVSVNDTAALCTTDVCSSDLIGECGVCDWYGRRDAQAITLERSHREFGAGWQFSSTSARASFALSKEKVSTLHHHFRWPALSDDARQLRLLYRRWARACIAEGSVLGSGRAVSSNLAGVRPWRARMSQRHRDLSPPPTGARWGGDGGGAHVCVCSEPLRVSCPRAGRKKYFEARGAPVLHL